MILLPKIRCEYVYPFMEIGKNSVVGYAPSFDLLTTSYIIYIYWFYWLFDYLIFKLDIRHIFLKMLQTQ